MPESPQTECLNCGYNLTGLPPEHRCPECGQAYDASARVWRPRHPRMRYLGLLGVAPVIFLALDRAAAILRSLQRGLPFHPADPFILAAAAMITVYFGWLVRSAVRGRMFAAITREALHVRMRGMTRAVPWTQVREVSAPEGGGVLVTRLDGRSMHVKYVFDARDDRDGFVAAAREAMKQAGTDSSRDEPAAGQQTSS